MNKCLFCGSDVNNKYCSISCQNKHQSKIRNNKKYGVFKDFKVNCISCGKEIIINEREKLFPKKEKYYCSRSCANKRVISDEHKQKTSFTLKKWYKSHSHSNTRTSTPNTRVQPNLKLKKLKLKSFIKTTCNGCGKNYIKRKKKQRFCSVICARNNLLQFSSIGGRKSAQLQNKRSKNEIYFAELCEKHFNYVYFNKKMFNGWDADVIIDDYKVAILWNGIWHYKQITKKHSLKQVQNRDKIKIKEIKKLGYEPYVIKDLGKYDKSFVENEFKKFKNILAG